MAEKVKLSKDGASIDFIQTDQIPTSLKKFRQSPEIEGFYRFVFENDLQKEAFEVLSKIVAERKLSKKAQKHETAALAKEAAKQAANELAGKTAVSKKENSTDSGKKMISATPKKEKNAAAKIPLVKAKALVKKAKPSKPAPAKKKKK